MARIAFIVGPDFQDEEFQVPYDRLRTAGHECVVLGTEAGQEVPGKYGRATATTDAAVGDASPDDFDAFVIPGGYAPDKLRLHEPAVAFTRKFVESGRPVAAICHAGQLLIEAGVVAGRTLTSWPSVRTDLINAGAEWVDREVVEDGNLITSRKPDDLDAFVGALLGRLG